MRKTNLRSALPRARPGAGMAGFDRLPAPLRAWLREAVLPWSAASVLRVWRAEAGRRAGGEPGCEAEQIARTLRELDRLQVLRLACDAATVREVAGGAAPTAAPFPRSFMEKMKAGREAGPGRVPVSRAATR